MAGGKRTPLQDEVVRALIETKAIDFEAVGALFSKFGAQAALEGDSLVHIITKKVTWACGWPGPEIFRAEDIAQFRQ
ncbi:MAG: hypothetical protein CVT65_11125 [Actinobacteria bacterium HGW-Actinobacteria-5]|jgi:hypothetical protein|nr:MAG: hypothetical protein CVT65_11125 [Actinobacteria bacterium HGW-Actinobacteria-5]